MQQQQHGHAKASSGPLAGTLSTADVSSGPAYDGSHPLDVLAMLREAVGRAEGAAGIPLVAVVPTVARYLWLLQLDAQVRQHCSNNTVVAQHRVPTLPCSGARVLQATAYPAELFGATCTCSSAGVARTCPRVPLVCLPLVT